MSQNNQNKWYDLKGDHSEVAVSTRVRLARNLRGYPFPARMNAEQARQVLIKVSDALISGASGLNLSLTELTSENRQEAASMVERHLISPEFAQGRNVRGVVLSPDESVSVMINEEDHLRIQVLGPGLCLDDCLKEAERLDTLLDETLPYAFDERLGFLTNCPTNLGTGLRASVMLHLPALSRTGALREIVSAAGKLGFAVRGMYGEGSAARGDLYQLSNQFTLGFTESQIAGRMMDSVHNIISQELAAREELKKRNSTAFEDKVWRAFGILSSARLLSSQEAEALLSELRLGSACGVIGDITPEQIDRLFFKMQPMTLSLSLGGKMPPAGRDAARAQLIGNTLKTK